MLIEDPNCKKDEINSHQLKENKSVSYPKTQNKNMGLTDTTALSDSGTDDTLNLKGEVEE